MKANEFLSVFIVGLGRRAAAHIESLRRIEGYRLVGGFDTDARARARWQSGQWKVTGELERSIGELKPDVLLLATPPAVRLELLRKVLDSYRPKAVVVEKPLALSYKEAGEITELCRRNGIKLVVSHQLPFSDEFSALLAKVSQGEIGAIRRIGASCFGSGFDQGSHLVDLALRLLGRNEIDGWVEATGCDDLRALAAVAPITADHQPDLAHHGRAWTSARWRNNECVDVEFQFGLLAPVVVPQLGPWLQKRIVVEGTDGRAEAHVASHFKMWKVGSEQIVSQANDVAGYERALDRFYAQLHALVAGNEVSELIDNNRDLSTVRLLEAIDRAAVRGTPMPLDTGGNVTGKAESSDAPRHACEVSVILPMTDHRGMGPDAVRGWTADQRCDSNSYELIVLLDDEDGHLEPILRPLLRPQDRLIVKPVHTEMEHYDMGARMARGRIVFFTEPHCVPEREVISEAISFFEHHDVDGLCARTIPIARNGIARMESRMYDEGFVEWSKPGHWTKVILRGVAIKREVYLAVGGFKYKYDRFCEWLLAAELKRNGHTILYAPAVGVSHMYSETLSLLDDFIESFTEGECQYRTSTPDQAFFKQFFGDPPEWSLAQNYSAGLKRDVMRSLLGVALKPGGQSVWTRFSAAWNALRCLPGALLGRRWLLSRYFFDAWLAKVQAGNLLLPERWRYRHFFDYWVKTTMYFRVRYVLRQAREARRDLQSGAAVNGDKPVIVNHYPSEERQGRRFHWTPPVFGISFDASKDRRHLVLDIPGIRGGAFWRQVRLMANGTVVAPARAEETADGAKVHFELPEFAIKKGEIIGFAPPWWGSRLRGDRRKLGVPIADVSLV